MVSDTHVQCIQRENSLALVCPSYDTYYVHMYDRLCDGIGIDQIGVKGEDLATFFLFVLEKLGRGVRGDSGGRIGHPEIYIYIFNSSSRKLPINTHRVVVRTVMKLLPVYCTSYSDMCVGCWVVEARDDRQTQNH